MEHIRIIDKARFFIVQIGQVYLTGNNNLTPILSNATQYPNYNAASYAADLWLETTH
ncbi:hypothetical protein LCGC14_1750380 [marine sediment metagenome]|uniref:Uncharacterized protein n=1 Tax=marine sediment metagenome TaxID=412755 RepID=A0A0F9H442_9ZZZZ